MANIKINPDALRTGRDIVRHKVQRDGVNVFRILPPTENANGYPYQRWIVTWGLLDPVKNTSRPYASSLTSEGKCPVHEYYGLLEQKIKAKELELAHQGKTEKEAKAILKPLNEFLWALRLKKVFVYNAANQEGKLGLLEVTPTTHAQIKKIMGSYYSSFNMDPTSLSNTPDDSGIWFKIDKTGEGLKTEYSVSINQTTERDKATGRVAHFDDSRPLPEELIQNYSKTAYDLSSVYQVLTYDELRTVLMANIKRIGNPELLLEGFDDVDLNAVSAPVITTGSMTSIAGATTNPKVKVNIVAMAAEDTTEADNDDYFAQAEAILNGTK